MIVLNQPPHSFHLRSRLRSHSGSGRRLLEMLYIHIIRAINLSSSLTRAAASSLGVCQGNADKPYDPLT